MFKENFCQVPLLKIAVTPVAPDEIVEWISKYVHERTLILGHNLHSVYLYHSGGNFRDTYGKARVVLVDGFPVLLVLNLARLFKMKSPLRGCFRTGSCDWIPILGDSKTIRRIAVIGARSASNAGAVRMISMLHSEFVVQGWDGFADLDELLSTKLKSLNAFDPDLVLVGLGMPMQEQFIYENFDLLPQCPIAAVGGAVDQLSGAQASAPRFLGPVGLEWVYRLLSDPRRLGHRYLVEPIKLCVMLFKMKKSGWRSQ